MLGRHAEDLSSAVGQMREIVHSARQAAAEAVHDGICRGRAEAERDAAASACRQLECDKRAAEKENAQLRAELDDIKRNENELRQRLREQGVKISDLEDQRKIAEHDASERAERINRLETAYSSANVDLEAARRESASAVDEQQRIQCEFDGFVQQITDALHLPSACPADVLAAVLDLSKRAAGVAPDHPPSGEPQKRPRPVLPLREARARHKAERLLNDSDTSVAV